MVQKLMFIKKLIQLKLMQIFEIHIDFLKH